MSSRTGIDIHIPGGHILLLYLQIHHRRLLQVEHTGKLLLLIGLLIDSNLLNSIAHNVGHSRVGITDERLAVHKY